MKYKLLSVEGKGVNNIGDYIQALASSQFLPQIDGFINREGLADYDGDECKVIMNGWYMHNPKEWPPSSKIHPLFVSMHINKTVSDEMVVGEGLDYLKKESPIGCRDTNTLEMLKNRGVDAFFSGCMTLTLGEKYKSSKHGDKVYFVDPVVPLGGGLRYLTKDVCFLLWNLILVLSISKKMIVSRKWINNVIISARFARLYSKVFSKTTLRNGEYISQESSRFTKMSNEQRLQEAERLITIYSEAKFVVTKRIHCALPCLGIETPVYFIQKDDDSDISSCRFGGLTELFNRIMISRDGLRPDFEYKDKLSESNLIKNKESWKPLARKLSKMCKDFVQDNSVVVQ